MEPAETVQREAEVNINAVCMLALRNKCRPRSRTQIKFLQMKHRAARSLAQAALAASTRPQPTLPDLLRHDTLFPKTLHTSCCSASLGYFQHDQGKHSTSASTARDHLSRLSTQSLAFLKKTLVSSSLHTLYSRALRFPSINSFPLNVLRP